MATVALKLNEQIFKTVCFCSFNGKSSVVIFLLDFDLQSISKAQVVRTMTNDRVEGDLMKY